MTKIITAFLLGFLLGMLLLIGTGAVRAPDIIKDGYFTYKEVVYTVTEFDTLETPEKESE